MNVQLVEVTNKALWMWALEQVGGADVYYTPGYLIPLAQRGEGRPILAYIQDGRRFALHVTFVRKLSSISYATPEFSNKIDMISPYGFSGPLVNDKDPGFVESCWQAWTDTALSYGAVSEFIRFHPMFQNYLLFAEMIDVELNGHTVYIDMIPDRLESGLSRTCARNIQTAYKKGLEFELLNPVEWLNEFLEMYNQTMDRNNATNYYYFDEDYFVRLFDELLDRVWLARVHHNGETGAFGLFLRHFRYLHYHLGCSNYDLRSYCPTNLLIYEAALLAQKRGKLWFHLGGAYQDNLGLYRFKQGFSDKTMDFYIGRKIYDQSAYDKLVELRKRASDKKVRTDFFPAYRSPM